VTEPKRRRPTRPAGRLALAGGERSRPGRASRPSEQKRFCYSFDRGAVAASTSVDESREHNDDKVHDRSRPVHDVPWSDSVAISSRMSLSSGGLRLRARGVHLRTVNPAWRLVRVGFGELPSVVVAQGDDMWALDRRDNTIRQGRRGRNVVVDEFRLGEQSRSGEAWDLEAVRDSLDNRPQ
jgi:hypothetical protein